MFRFTLFVVGRLKNKALVQLCDDFTKRLARRGSLQIVEFKDGSLRSESDRLRTALAAKQDHEVFVLAEEGRAYSSHEFAEKLQLHRGKPLLFIIVEIFRKNMIPQEALTAWNQRLQANGASLDSVISLDLYS